jgi:myo-inositol 2-dehydrogenase/D-chiro-inositol 1-dehydrogenase
LDRQPLVTPEHAKMVMQVYQAADLSAETGQPVDVVVEERPAEAPSLV